MNDPQLPPVVTNGALASFDLDSKKDKKKWKKKMKKAEELHRRALVEKLDQEHPRLDGKPVELPPAPIKAPPSLRIQAWLRSATKALDAQRAMTSQKSSFLVAINCVMLAIASHGLYSGPLEVGPLKWALIPLALTNVLSLAFAILSAQLSRTGTTLNQLWSVPADQFDANIAALLQHKQRAYASLSSDLHLEGVELSHRQAYLRTSYNVLLGGVTMSALLFAVCLAVATRG